MDGYGQVWREAVCPRPSGSDCSRTVLPSSNTESSMEPWKSCSSTACRHSSSQQEALYIGRMTDWEGEEEEEEGEASCVQQRSLTSPVFHPVSMVTLFSDRMIKHYKLRIHFYAWKGNKTKTRNIPLHPFAELPQHLVYFEGHTWPGGVGKQGHLHLF